MKLFRLALIGLATLAISCSNDKEPRQPDVPQFLIDDLSSGFDLTGAPLLPSVVAPNVSIPRAPGIEWAPTKNFYPRYGDPIQAIVLHVTGGGSCDGIRDYFQYGPVSANFLICPDRLIQQVEIADGALHAGIWGRTQNLTNPIIAEWYGNGLDKVNPNLRTVGIETLLKPGQNIKEFPEMRNKLVNLLLYLTDITGIPADRTHIIGHFELDGTNRPIDPRCCLDIDAIVAEVQQLQANREYRSQFGECNSDACWHIPTQLWIFENGPPFDPIQNRFLTPPLD